MIVLGRGLLANVPNFRTLLCVYQCTLYLVAQGCNRHFERLECESNYVEMRVFHIDKERELGSVVVHYDLVSHESRRQIVPGFFACILGVLNTLDWLDFEHDLRL